MNNGLAGIALVGDTTIYNGLIPVIIGANGGLPIDLGNDGHTANGSQIPPGPDNWMNYPVVSMTVDGGFTGTSCPGCVVRFYQTISDVTANGGGGALSILSGGERDNWQLQLHFPGWGCRRSAWWRPIIPMGARR